MAIERNNRSRMIKISSKRSLKNIRQHTPSDISSNNFCRRIEDETVVTVCPWRAHLRQNSSTLMAEIRCMSWIHIFPLFYNQRLDHHPLKALGGTIELSSAISSCSLERRRRNGEEVGEEKNNLDTIHSQSFALFCYWAVQDVWTVHFPSSPPSSWDGYTVQRTVFTSRPRLLTLVCLQRS